MEKPKHTNEEILVKIKALCGKKDLLEQAISTGMNTQLEDVLMDDIKALAREIASG